MHVVHLDLERSWRGGQRQVFLLVRELARQGIRQTLICREGTRYPGLLAGFSGVDTVTAPHRIAAWRRRPGGDDVIYHAHSGNTIPLAVLGARKCPSVITRRLDLPIHPWLFRRASAVVAISPGVERVLLEAGLPPERVRLIPDGVDLRRRLDAQASMRLRERSGVRTGQFVGLTVAAMAREKDPLTLVRALTLLPADYRHVWVGDGEMWQPTADLANELGVSDKLALIGFDADPDPWFGVADAFVLPSVFEGLGTVFLDAFHFSVPVVGTNIPGTSELLENGVSALKFPTGDSEALAACMRRLMDDPALRESISTEGSRRVTAFDIRDVASQYLGLYRELLN